MNLRANTTYTIHLAAVSSGGIGPAVTETVTTLEPGNLYLFDILMLVC